MKNNTKVLPVSKFFALSAESIVIAGGMHSNHCVLDNSGYSVYYSI